MCFHEVLYVHDCQNIGKRHWQAFHLSIFYTLHFIKSTPTTVTYRDGSNTEALRVAARFY